MPSPASFYLRLVHTLYNIFTILHACFWQLKRPTAMPLEAPRKQLPRHLALLLCSDEGNDEEIVETYVESVKRARAWCQIAGIRELTVYDREGVLLSCSQQLRASLRDVSQCQEEESDLEMDYPWTPPLSDCSDSTSSELDPFPRKTAVTPFLTTLRIDNRKPIRHKSVSRRWRTARKLENVVPDALTIHIASRAAGKPLLASIAQSLARANPLQDPYAFKLKGNDRKLSVQDLNGILEGEYGLSSPDLMIIHRINPTKSAHNVLELHGFPPWQIRLTEFKNTHHVASWRWLYQSPDRLVALEELEFRAALDGFASAEMRLGR